MHSSGGSSAPTSRSASPLPPVANALTDTAALELDTRDIEAFGAKQQRFEDFIAKLRALAPLDYTSPTPPTTLARLAAWQAELDSLRAEVQGCDKGELAPRRARTRVAAGRR